MVKAGFIADPVILDLIEGDPAGGRRPGGCNAAGTGSAGRAGQGRGRRGRPRESGLREILNYGHTLAHAIERVEDYQWRHGDAVAVGLVFAAALGRRDRPAGGGPRLTGIALSCGCSDCR